MYSLRFTTSTYKSKEYLLYFNFEVKHSDKMNIDQQIKNVIYVFFPNSDENEYKNA